MNPSQLTIPAEQLVALAVQVHRQGKWDEAETLYRRVLQERPRHVDALHFLGVLLHSRGRSDEAIRSIRAAVQENPRYVDARINLGNVYKESGRFAEAEAQYRLALKWVPENADAWNNLGAVLRVQKKLDESIDAYRSATELAPDHADAFQNLGNALKAAGQFEDALTAYRQAIEIDPKHCDAHLNLGRALYRFGRLDEAALVYAKWLEVEPGNPVAQHMLVACRGEEIPERCSDDFVRESFDAFASSFDEVLQRLDYRAPELVAEAVAAELGSGDGSLNVLDAGCGTGLCGAALRPYAGQLAGVDLSPKMLDKAGQTRHYDELQAAELTDYLSRQPARFELVVSADTLCYFGRLDAVLSAAAAAIRSGGRLIFTLERSADDAPQPYTLHPHGRYSHRHQYAETSLRETGFEVVSIRETVLRQEIQQPVAGLLIVARRVQS